MNTTTVELLAQLLNGIPRERLGQFTRVGKGLYKWLKYPVINDSQVKEFSTTFHGRAQIKQLLAHARNVRNDYNSSLEIANN